MATMAEKALGVRADAEPTKKISLTGLELAGHELALRILDRNLQNELRHRRRPQQAVPCSNVAGTAGALVAAQGQSYTLTCTMPTGFSFDRIVASECDILSGHFMLLDVAAGDYNMATGDNHIGVPGPLDVFDVRGAVEAAIAPWVQEDGKLKAPLTLAITILCLSADTFHGFWVVGTTSGKRCALRDLLDRDRRGPASVLKELKEANELTGRQLLDIAIRKVPRALRGALERVERALG